jgi:hypothetical protein
MVELDQPAELAGEGAAAMGVREAVPVIVLAAKILLVGRVND